MTGGRKDDNGKLPYQLLPPEALMQITAVLQHGAKKYDEHNWRRGMAWTRLFGAVQRHLWSWLSPHVNDEDPETGISHLAHAACGICFLLAYEMCSLGVDDRWKGKETQNVKEKEGAHPL